MEFLNPDKLTVRLNHFRDCTWHSVCAAHACELPSQDMKILCINTSCWSILEMKYLTSLKGVLEESLPILLDNE